MSKKATVCLKLKLKFLKIIESLISSYLLKYADRLPKVRPLNQVINHRN